MLPPTSVVLIVAFGLAAAGREIVFVNTFCNGFRGAKMGGKFEFCPMACDKYVDVGIVSVKKLEFCPVAYDK